MNPYERLQQAFSSRKKPGQFTNPDHCDDCREFNDILISFDRDSISYKELGNIAWNPISSSNTEGFLYYLPALARLAKGSGEHYFIDQFLIHVNNDERLNALQVHEKKSLQDYLVWLRSELKTEIDNNLDAEELDELILKLDT